MTVLDFATPAPRAATNPDPSITPEPDTRVLELDPDRVLSPETVERAACGRGSVVFSAASEAAMHASKDAIDELARRGDAVYGLTTGFGPLVEHRAPACARAQGTGLIDHLGAGFGPLASDDVVRATIIARCRSLANGCSGIGPSAARALAALVDTGVTPEVPELGSVGASGDLIPLAHIARCMSGLGFARVRGARMPAGDALSRAGLTPQSLDARDALAIVNGTSFMTGYAVLALVRAERLLSRAERTTGFLYRVLGARASALDGRLHQARGHQTQCESAANILHEASIEGAWEDTGRPLQEVYSIRCAPQFFGACRDSVAHARGVITRELNGVNDNPVIVPGVDGRPPEALHGGNFQGQQIAFASDILNHALVQGAIVIERQLDVALNPEFNGGAPLLLAWEPGASSGFAGAQITATAVVAEMRHHNQPAGNASMPTNGRNQDVVSMGTMAARTVFEQTDRLATVLGCLAMAAQQLVGLRRAGRADGPTPSTPAWMPRFELMTGDRALRDDLERCARAFIGPVTTEAGAA